MVQQLLLSVVDVRVGERIKGRIKKLSSSTDASGGAVVELSQTVNALCPLDQMSELPLRSIPPKFKVSTDPKVHSACASRWQPGRPSRSCPAVCMTRLWGSASLWHHRCLEWVSAADENHVPYVLAVGAYASAGGSAPELPRSLRGHRQETCRPDCQEDPGAAFSHSYTAPLGTFHEASPSPEERSLGR